LWWRGRVSVNNKKKKKKNWSISPKEFTEFRRLLLCLALYFDFHHIEKSSLNILQNMFHRRKKLIWILNRKLILGKLTFHLNIRLVVLHILSYHTPPNERN